MAEGETFEGPWRADAPESTPSLDALDGVARERVGAAVLDGEPVDDARLAPAAVDLAARQRRSAGVVLVGVLLFAAVGAVAIPWLVGGREAISVGAAVAVAVPVLVVGGATAVSMRVTADAALRRNRLVAEGRADAAREDGASRSERAVAVVGGLVAGWLTAAVAGGILFGVLSAFGLEPASVPGVVRAGTALILMAPVAVATYRAMVTRPPPRR